jgi:hypothetical protein
MNRREEILARLLAIAEAAPDVKNAARNKDEISDLARPAIVVMDGDEEADSNDPESRPTHAPRIVHMRPEIVILLSATPESIGTSLNTLQAALYKAIVTDAALISLARDGRSMQSIRYLGSETTIERGRAAEGKRILHFLFTYPLCPEEL